MKKAKEMSLLSKLKGNKLTYAQKHYIYGGTGGDDAVDFDNCKHEDESKCDVDR